MLTAARLGVEFTTEGVPRTKRDIQDVGNAISGTNKKGQGFLKGAFSTMTGVVGAGLLQKAAGGVMDVGKAFVWGASDTAEAQSKVNTVFGDSAGVIDAWAATSANSFGLTKVQALDSAGTFGNLFTSMGFGQDAAAGMSTQFLGLASDLGSFNNVPTPEALAAIQSGLVGEYEPLRKFGVLLSADAISLKALEMGLGDANGELTEQEKVLARNALIMEQTTTAQGDFARTSDGLANKTRILQANLSNLAASAGTALLPTALKLTGWGVDAIQWVGKLGERFQFWRNAGLSPVQAALTVLGGVIRKTFGAGAFQAFQKIVKVTGDVVDVLKDIGKVAKTVGTAFAKIAAPALIAFLGFIADHFDIIGPLVAGAVAGFLAFSAVMGTVSAVAGFFVPILAAIAAQGGIVAVVIAALTSPIFLVIAAFAALFLAYQKNFLGFADGVNAVAARVMDAFRVILDGLTILKAAFDEGGWSAVWDTIVEGFTAIDWGGMARAAGQSILDALRGLASGAPDVFQWISDALGNALQGMSDALASGLQLAWDQIASINWTDWIETLAWATYVTVMDWATWVSELLWDAFISSLTWSDHIPGLDWAFFIGVVVWAGFITLLEWSAFVTSLVWDFFLEALNWATFVAPFVWSEFVTALDWTIILVKLSWDGWLTILDWSLFVAPFVWDFFVDVLDWALFVGFVTWTGFITILDWSLFVAPFVWDFFVDVLDWTIFVVALAWGTYVKALNWATYVASVVWDFFVDVLSWADFVLDLAWSGFVAVLSWLDFIADLSWSSFVPSVSWGDWIPDFPGWSSLFGGGGGGLTDEQKEGIRNVPAGPGGGRGPFNEGPRGVYASAGTSDYGAGGGRADGLKDALIRITADTTDALAKIQAVKDAIAGLGGGGMGRAAMGAGAGSGVAAAAVINVDTAPAMTALDTAKVAIDAAVTTWPTIINTAAALMGSAALNAGMVAGFGVVNGLAMAQPLIDAAVMLWSGGIDLAAATMGSAALNAGMVAGFGVVNGLAMAQPMIDAAVGLWSTAIDTAAGLMGAAGLNAGAAAGFGVSNGMAMAAGAITGQTASWTAAINAQAGPMGAAGLNAGASGGFGVANGLDMASGSISGAIGAWPGIIDGIAGAMGSAGKNAGAAAGFGVANGINMGYDSAVGAATRLAEGVNAALAAVIKPGSPSKVTTWMGHMIAQGLSVGMLSELGNVASASTRLGGAAMPSLSTGAGSLSVGNAGGGALAPRVFSPTVTIQIDATGKDLDEEKIAELAATRTMQTLVILAQEGGR